MNANQNLVWKNFTNGFSATLSIPALWTHFQLMLQKLLLWFYEYIMISLDLPS